MARFKSRKAMRLVKGFGVSAVESHICQKQADMGHPFPWWGKIAKHRR
jgi:hypothetical protein